MFARLLRPRRRPPRPAPPRARPGVEALEPRYCPAAPTLTLQVQELAGNQVRVSGQVTDEAPATVTVTFGGQVSGSTTPSASGSYSFTTTATGLGGVWAYAQDEQASFSSPVLGFVTSAAPSLTLEYTWLPGRRVRLTGQVTDEFSGGRTVTFSGAASGTTTTDSRGAYAVELDATALGPVVATTTDQWNLGPMTAPTVALTNAPPQIQDFVGSQLTATTWKFTGRVVDEVAGGLTITFSNLNSIQGLTVTTNEDGTFELTVSLAEGEFGLAMCSVTDMWGAEATAEYFVQPT